MLNESDYIFDYIAECELWDEYEDYKRTVFEQTGKEPTVFDFAHEIGFVYEG